MSLTNLTFVNTRPTHQAETLNQLLASAGVKTINFPTLKINAINATKTKSICQRLNMFDIAIFNSANAAHCSQAYWPALFPISIVIAIGPGTEKTLNEYGINHTILPEHYSSQGILALPELGSAQNKNIIIFCGQQSKPLLYKTLIERKATVTRCECYRRACPEPDESVLALLNSKKIDGIISTSQESLLNLNTLLKNHAAIKKTTLIVISPEMKMLAKAQGWHKIFIAPNASNEAILQTLKQFVNSLTNRDR